jgi:DNA repair protein RadA/Sms
MRTKTCFRCSACGGDAPRWLGRCPSCEEWGTLVEVAPQSASRARAVLSKDPRFGPVPIGEVRSERARPRPTGVDELDRVLGGGLVPGGVALLAGEPGAGKSTLLLQSLGAMAAAGARCLLIAAEESTAQVAARAERVGAVDDGLFVVAETSLPHVVAHVDALAPDVLAVDSIQAVCDPDLPGAAGSVSQVRDGASRLVQLAKERDLATVLVGHVTKEGTLAGPRVLEHVVDTVLSFDGAREHTLRLLHALKHRFAGTSEVGLFEMTPRGLVDVPDASARFLLDRRVGATGSAVAPVLEGTRPVLVEVQALAACAHPPVCRSAAGVEGGRVALVLAVLEQHAGVRLRDADVYVNVAGGLRVSDTGLDVALALAVASARRGAAVDPAMVAVGELGLGGEVRSVPQLGRRLAEAARLGFTTALVPPGTTPLAGMRMRVVATLGEALRAGLLDV